jgi:hypothetical protein
VKGLCNLPCFSDVLLLINPTSLSEDITGSNLAIRIDCSEIFVAFLSPSEQILGKYLR